MGKKTLAMIVLDSKNISYRVQEYPTDERDAEKIAHLIDADPSQVYKTLVVKRTENKPLLVMIPSDRQLDLKKVAQAVGAKKLKMASYAEAENLTGLQVGGISALALLNRGFDIFLDRHAVQYPMIYVSAGKRGLQIGIAPEDLQALTGAEEIDAVR